MHIVDIERWRGDCDDGVIYVLAERDPRQLEIS